MSKAYANIIVRATNPDRRETDPIWKTLASDTAIQRITNMSANQLANSSQMTPDQAQQIINKLASWYDEQTLYNFVVKHLSSDDPNVRKTVYNAIIQDQYAPQQKLKKYSNGGAYKLSAAQRQEIVTDALAKKSALGYARAAKFKNSRKATEYAGGPEKKAKPSILALGYYTDLVKYGGEDVTEDIIMTTNPIIEEPEDRIVVYGGYQYKIPDISSEENALTLFTDSCNEVVFAPMNLEDDWIENRANLIYNKFKESSAMYFSSPIDPTFIKNIFYTLHQMVPAVEAADQGKEQAFRLMNDLITNIKTGDLQLAVTQLASLSADLSRGLVSIKTQRDQYRQNALALKEEGESATNEARATASGIKKALEDVQSDLTKQGLELKERNTELAEKNAQVSSLKERISLLEKENKRIADDYESKLRTEKIKSKSAIEQAIEDNRRDKAKFEQEKRDSENLYEKNKEEIVKLTSQLGAAERERDDLKLQIARATGTLERAIGVNGGLAAGVYALVEKAENAEASAEVFKKGKAEAERLLQEMTEQRGKLEADLVATKAKDTQKAQIIANMETQMREIEEKLAKNASDLELAQSLQASAAADARNKAQRVIDLESQIKRGVLSSEIEVKKKEAEIASLKEEIRAIRLTEEDYKKQAANLKSSGDDLNRRNNELNNQKRQAEQEVAEKASQIDALNATITELQGIVDKYKSLNDAQLQQLEEAKAALSENAELLNKNNELAEQVKILNASKDSALKNQSERHLKEMAKLKEDKNKTIEELKRELEEERRKSRENSKKPTRSLREIELEGIVSRMQREASKLSNDNSSLQKQLEDERREKKRQSDEYNSRISLLEAEKNSILQDKKLSEGEKNGRIAELQKKLELVEIEKRTQAEEHSDDVIMSNVEPPVLPMETIKRVAGESLLLAGRVPRRPRLPKPAAVGTASNIPKRTKQAMQKSAARGKTATATAKKRKSSTKTSVGPSVVAPAPKKVRNSTRGGYVVGGRPDPLISPAGETYWKNVYNSRKLLF